ncbi:hypothetical protein Cpir12675_005180 [Ceratocystis pirilliformis]|uniref:Uncharacterized protein n=1 Tax=Ceratocystis pirilliformis TaxID=259994 RepID=A0ABR3YUA5_9PEZI
MVPDTWKKNGLRDGLAASYAASDEYGHLQSQNFKMAFSNNFELVDMGRGAYDISGVPTTPKPTGGSTNSSNKK